MVRIRLRRVGAKRQPSYRIVVADRESPRDGRFLEVIGQYSPRTSPAQIDVDEERLFHWLQRGAQPSDSVLKLLRARGSWDRWLRLKQGEALEGLMAEARASRAPADLRTRRDVPAPRRVAEKAESGSSEAAE